MHASRHAILLATLLVCGGTPATNALAAIFTVGTGSGCTHATLAAAITAAGTSAGADTIRLTVTPYTQAAFSITTTQGLEIVGGFASCTHTTNDGNTTELDGQGGDAAPVLDILATAGAVVRLDGLVVRRGDVPTTAHGGGIRFRGDGELHIVRSRIEHNVAGYGGGISAEGLGPHAKLVIGEDVTVLGNSATYEGGGIHLRGITMEMKAPRSFIYRNWATGIGNDFGYGGGIMLRSGAYPALAHVGTPSEGDSDAAIQGNAAIWGGGIALVAGEDAGDVTLVVASADPERRLILHENTATRLGGAIFAKPKGGATPGRARVMLQNFEINSSTAQLGGAIALHDDLTIGAEAIVFPEELDAPCPVGKPCGYIHRVHASFSNREGAIIFLGWHARLTVQAKGSGAHGKAGLLIAHNIANGVVSAIYPGASVDLDNVVISNNDCHGPVLHAGGDVTMSVRGSTIAGNTILGFPLGVPPVLKADADAGVLSLDGTIVWQPGQPTVHAPYGVPTVRAVLASEVDSLGAGSDAFVKDPLFTRTDQFDYSLRAHSPAIDAAPEEPALERDQLGLPRTVDLLNVVNRGGPRDIGAFERQLWQSMVINGEFRDTFEWAMHAGTSYDWTQNASGSDTGSLRTSVTNFPPRRVVAASQCVFLPGPGRYLLNGYGRSGGGPSPAERDATLLHWELRRVGTGACTSGAPIASGDHFLGSSTSWRRPDTPAVIDVTPAQWTTTSSLAISLVVRDNGVVAPPNNSAVGWFDGITLEVAPSDVIFQDDFDPS